MATTQLSTSTTTSLADAGLLILRIAVIAAMIDAWAVNVSAAAFWSDPFNVPFMIAVGATALLFTGAGGYSIDARIFGRWRLSARVAMGLLILAIAAALLTWILLNGTNPIHFTAPEG